MVLLAKYKSLQRCVVEPRSYAILAVGIKALLTVPLRLSPAPLKALAVTLPTADIAAPELILNPLTLPDTLSVVPVSDSVTAMLPAARLPPVMLPVALMVLVMAKLRPLICPDALTVVPVTALAAATLFALTLPLALRSDNTLPVMLIAIVLITFAV